MPSYIKDTSDFINTSNEMKNMQIDKILITLEVKSLNTNIPNHKGIEAVKSTLNSVSKIPIATKVTIRYLFLIVTFNNLVFNGIYYLKK